MAYTKLFNSIVTSTIWTEDDQTRIVWITMLALADKHGEVQGSVPGLARIAGVPVEATRRALEKFQQPDPDSRTQDDQGRRIETIDGGWALINHAKYRAMASKEDEKTANATRQKRFQDKRKRNATITPNNAQVTPDRDIAEADANTDAKAESNPNSNADANVHPPSIVEQNANENWCQLGDQIPF
jgi:hypothetical protein